ncbi:MAG: hypothetical protein KJO53_04480 [Eudoraea sp.]|nr:hypothetical protein [Eudoraea sp.]NNL02977.1 hypothetical protein [Eudoraea sp.]
MNMPNSFEEFLKTCQNERPPEKWPKGLQALWYDAKGNWNASHDIAQDMPSILGSWIHAYLHRKEGDQFNANYWYRRANRELPNLTLDEELKNLVEYVINNQSMNWSKS